MLLSPAWLRAGTSNPAGERIIPLIRMEGGSMFADGERSADSPRERRAVLEAIVASTIGTTIEWYDFFLYGTAAALVFPRLFFPGFDPVSGLLLSFGPFTPGFVARPF